MKSISLMTFVAGVAFSALTGSAFAAGDPAAGEKVFAKCKACHQIGEDGQERHRARAERHRRPRGRVRRRI